MDADLDIQDLCAVADVTPRTVYFYIQQGLLQSPDGSGRGAKYGPRHVVRLRLISGCRRNTCRSPKSAAGSTR